MSLRPLRPHQTAALDGLKASLMAGHEVWLPVVGYEGFYEVSDLGRIRSLGRVETMRNRWGSLTVRTKRGCLMKASPNHNGYPAVWLYDAGGNVVGKLVHRLVAEAFIGPIPDGMDVAHNDGTRTNARLENLRITTRADNCADKEIHGTVQRGERSSRAKLSADAVREIRDANGAKTQKELAAQFGVRQGQISRIQLRKNWRHIDG